ncbi:MAG: nucleotidyltransferase domain-containing protein [Candidatus Omnitrophica bacterium]|nr:nucleotidyltransferase domain-containing protein [Candidatus Omnitrophota bacterium]
MYKLCRIDLGRSQEIIKKLDLYVEEITKKINPQCIILFGSFAKNDFNEASDIDLVVIADFKEGFLERIKLLMDINDHYKLPLEPIGYTPQEFREMKERKNSFIENLSREGKILFGHLES